jgi:hypothetical protein
MIGREPADNLAFTVLRIGAGDCTRPTPPRQIISCNAGAIHRGH